MLAIPAQAAFSTVLERPDRNHHFPGQGDARYRSGGLFPRLYPTFELSPASRIFTMGSCFARHIENALGPYGVDLPVRGFTIPEAELPYPGPHLLNEYNAGTIAQRLNALLGRGRIPDGAGVEEGTSGAVDLLLHIASRPVTLERLQARRAEIAALYAQLPSCDTLILTLGLVEAWYDRETGCYLNRAPSYRTVKRQPDRFEFRRFDLEDVVSLLRPVLQDLLAGGLGRVLLTVSPVPMEVSFMPGDIVVNNSYSKSVLRCACERLARGEPRIDYFPSYEIVTSFGHEGGFIEDGVHPRPGVVQQVIAHMTEAYFPWRILAGEELEAVYAAWAAQGRRVLLYPAGSQARDMLAQSPALRQVTVALGDSDPARPRASTGGLPVLGPGELGPEVADTVLIASLRFEDEIHDLLAGSLPAGMDLIRYSRLSRRWREG